MRPSMVVVSVKERVGGRQEKRETGKEREKDIERGGEKERER